MDNLAIDPQTQAKSPLKRVRGGLDKSPAPTQWKRIFVLEDDLSLAHILDRVLRNIDENIEIDWATSAEEAIEMLKNKTEMMGSTPYDLIIADIFLEGKMTGLDFWKVCEAVYSDIPIVVTSGLPVDKFFSAVGRDKICPPFLQKPFTIGECKQVLKSLLNYQPSE